MPRRRPAIATPAEHFVAALRHATNGRDRDALTALARAARTPPTPHDVIAATSEWGPKLATPELVWILTHLRHATGTAHGNRNLGLASAGIAIAVSPLSLTVATSATFGTSPIGHGLTILLLLVPLVIMGSSWIALRAGAYSTRTEAWEIVLEHLLANARERDAVPERCPAARRGWFRRRGPL